MTRKNTQFPTRVWRRGKLTSCREGNSQRGIYARQAWLESRSGHWPSGRAQNGISATPRVASARTHTHSHALHTHTHAQSQLCCPISDCSVCVSPHPTLPLYHRPRQKQTRNSNLQYYLLVSLLSMQMPRVGRGFRFLLLTEWLVLCSDNESIFI